MNTCCNIRDVLFPLKLRFFGVVNYSDTRDAADGQLHSLQEKKTDTKINVTILCVIAMVTKKYVSYVGTHDKREK